MNRRHPIVTASATALFVFAACSSPPYAARTIDDDAEMESNVTVTDSELYDVLHVGRNPLVERVPGTDQLRVVVTLRNVDDEAIQVLAQMSFLNAQKQPIGDDTNKQVKLLAPGETITHTAISKSAEARDWQLRLSWNR